MCSILTLSDRSQGFAWYICFCSWYKTAQLAAATNDDRLQVYAWLAGDPRAHKTRIHVGLVCGSSGSSRPLLFRCDKSSRAAYARYSHHSSEVSSLPHLDVAGCADVSRRGAIAAGFRRVDRAIQCVISFRYTCCRLQALPNWMLA